MDGENKKLNLPYYYDEQPEQFSFYRIPKALFKAEVFQGLSLEAKFLYGLMLDRMELSIRNDWRDETGRVFIYYKLEHIQEDMKCQNQKATKLMAELERFGLIERKRPGQGKPTKIFVKDFTVILRKSKTQIMIPESRKSQVQTHENHDSRITEIMIPESLKSHTINTEINQTNNNNPETIESSIGGDNHDGTDVMDECESYLDYFKSELNFDILLQTHPDEKGELNEILDLLVETVSTTRETIRIGREEKPAQVVRSQLMKLNFEHIEYVMDCMRENTTQVRNIKQYLLTALYNAPSTINSYYRAKVNHDMHESLI